MNKAQINELQNILRDDNRQRAIQEGLRADYDAARDMSEEITPPGIEGDEGRDRRIPGERPAEFIFKPTDRSEVELTIPTTYRDKEYDFRAVEGTIFFKCSLL